MRINETNMNFFNSGKIPSISSYLGKIYKKTEKLSLPAPAYAGLKFSPYGVEIAVLTSEKVFSERLAAGDILSKIKQIAQEKNIKFIAAGLSESPGNLSSRLWLEEDIVPVELQGSYSAAELSQKAKEGFDNGDLAKIDLRQNNEVEPSKLVSLEDYKAACEEGEFETLLALAKKFHGKRISFFNSTPQGGGVALMRHALIRLYRVLGVDAHWYVLHDRRPEVFEVTKVKFHNVLQAVSDPTIVLTEEDKSVYNSWIEENAADWTDVFAKSDVIVIDDPQSSGLIPYVKKANPSAKIIFRSHIQIVARLADQAGTPQNITWGFLWSNIKDADLFISHPIKDFIPKEMAEKNPFLMPPATDPLDGLNKPLSKDQNDYYLKVFDKILIQEGQEPMDRQRPYLIQIARFDPSKGMPDVIESYAALRKRLSEEGKILPQLVIVGNGSIDDPDAVPIFNLVKEMILRKNDHDLSRDIKVVRIFHMDQLLNALLRNCKVALQLSLKEGFEVKVSEALMRAKPVVAYNSGGIPLQIQEGVSGFLVEAGDIATVARRLYELLTDDELYSRMSMAAEKFARHDVLTPANAIKWLTLATQLLKRAPVFIKA
jgi:alpha,alpha-trehalose phosphorylase (configuration-retaining)